MYPDDLEARLGALEHVSELAIVCVSDARGGERIACVAVPAEDAATTRAERHVLAKKTLDKALARLAPGQRSAITMLLDVPLPRTATRKVKRTELGRLLERVAPL